MLEVFELPPQFDRTSSSRGLGVAANIMTKFGYRQGMGLGLNEQGMSTALRIERTGKNVGLIISESTKDVVEVDDGLSFFVRFIDVCI